MNSIVKGYHGQSGLCVLNAPEKVKTLGPLSNVNRECLVKRANEIAVKLMNGGSAPEEQGFFTRFFSSNVDKGATQIGSYAAAAASQTYGSGVINKALEFIGRKVMGPMNERVFNLAIGATQMAVTPKVLPFLTAFSTAAGGVALPVAVGLVAMLYNRLLASGKYTLETLPSPDQLIKYDNEQKCFFDALGEELGKQELKDLQVLIQEYDLICKILASNKDDVPGVIMDALNFNSLEFKNLDPSAKKALEKEIEETTDRLQEENRYLRGEGILPGIAKLVANFIPFINRERVEEDQKMHSMLDSMDSILAKISAPSEQEQELFFDEETKSLYVPTNCFSRFWLRRSKAKTAEKVSSVMKAELLSQCDKIDALADKLKSISKEGMEGFRDKIFNLTKSFGTLYTVAQNSSDNEPMMDAVSNLFKETKIRLDAADTKLAAKMN